MSPIPEAQKISQAKPESESIKSPLTWDESQAVKGILRASLHDQTLDVSAAFSIIIDEFVAAGNPPEDITKLMLQIKSACETHGIKIPQIVTDSLPDPNHSPSSPK